MELTAIKSEQSDDELIAALALGEKWALAFLYDRYAPLMLGVAQRFLGGKREAEDLVHDVFLEMWKRADSYDTERGSVRAWIMLRLRSRALDRVKSVRATRTVLTDPGSIPSPVFLSEADLSLSPDRRRVVDALRKLPEEHQRVIQLAYFDGQTSSEIATCLGLPIGTVKSRMAAALTRLRESLVPTRRGLL